jgi:hypothetical protein
VPNYIAALNHLSIPPGDAVSDDDGVSAVVIGYMLELPEKPA